MTFPMPRIARRSRAGVIAATAATAVVGLSAPITAQAVPVSLTLKYTCNFPLMDPQPLTLTINSDIPTSVPLNTGTDPFVVTATAEVSAQANRGLHALETVSIEGTASAAAKVVNPPGGSNLSIRVPTTIEKTTLPAAGAFTTKAAGATPRVFFFTAGESRIEVGDDLILRLTPRLADGTIAGTDKFESECFQDPGQDKVLARIQVVGTGTDNPPTPPTELAGTSTSNSVTLNWKAATDDKGIAGYDVYKDDVLAQSVTGTTATIASLNPGTNYRFKVVAKDTKGQTATSTEVTVATKPIETGATQFSLSGSASLKTLTRGSVPLKGGLNLKLDGTNATADVTINKVRANLTALGFIPVTADVVFAPTGPATGTLAGGALKLQLKTRVLLPQVLAFGIPLAGGTNCQTRAASTINLQSTGTFTTTAGGTIAGAFSLSNLSGCGFLNGIVSPLTSGGGNTMAATLAPVK